MGLTCERVREVLWPLDRPRRHVQEEQAARDHLTRCDDCRAFFLRDAEVSRLLRRIADGLEIKATPGLRVSVARALAVTRRLSAAGESGTAVVAIPEADLPSSSRGRRAEVVAAAAALLLLLGGQILASRYGGTTDTARFAADFVRTAAVEFSEPGLDVRQVGGFYEREIGRNIVPVALHQAPVTRATVCDLDGDLGSMIEYDLGGTRLVHYRIPLDADRAESPLAGAPASVSSKRGVQVAHWADSDFEHALVSRASGDYLAWLAENRFSRPPSVTNYGSPASRSWRRIAAGD